MLDQINSAADESGVSHEQDRVHLSKTEGWELFYDLEHAVVGLMYTGWNQAAGVSPSGFVRQLHALDLHESSAIDIPNPGGGTSRVNVADMRLAHRQALLPLLELEPELELPMYAQIHLEKVRVEMEQFAALGLDRSEENES